MRRLEPHGGFGNPAQEPQGLPWTLVPLPVVRLGVDPRSVAGTGQLVSTLGLTGSPHVVPATGPGPEGGPRAVDRWRGDPPAPGAHSVDLISLWRVRQILQPQAPLPSGEGGSGGPPKLSEGEERRKWMTPRTVSKVTMACWSRGMILALGARGPGSKSWTSPLV